MNFWEPSQDLGTSAGAWGHSADNDYHYAAICGTQWMTTSAYPLPDKIIVDNSTTTSSGIFEVAAVDTEPQTIRHLREVSGLTWEQLSSVFDVSRRTLHNWDNGLAMASDNQEKLARIIVAIRSFDTGDASENRRLLLTSVGRIIPIDLLRKGHFSDFDKVKEFFAIRPQIPRYIAKLENDKPLAPDILMSAKQDRVHIEKPGKKSFKVKRSKRE